MTASALVFDWNCTLLDDFEAMHACMNIVMDMAGRQPITADFFRTHYDIPFEKLYENLGLNEEQVETIMRHNTQVFHDNYEPMANKTTLRDGAREALELAGQHGLEMLILSNHIVDPIRAQLKRLGVHEHFVEVLAYANHGVQFRDMPKGEKLRRYREERGVAPGHTLIVGDSLEEIEIAREQELVSVAVTGGCVSEARLAAAKPDYLIHSLHELVPIMRERGLVS